MSVDFQPAKPVKGTSAPPPTGSPAPKKAAGKPAPQPTPAAKPPKDQNKVNTGASRQAAFDAVAAGHEAYDESMADGHWSNDAARYWDGVIADNDKAVGNGTRGALAATAVYTGAKVMGFFVEMSGIRQVRARAAQLGTEVGGGASNAEIAKTSALLTGEMLLAASNGLGLEGVVRAGRVAAEGTAIVRAANTARTTEAVAGAVARHADDAIRSVTAVANAGKATIAGMRPVASKAAQQVARELEQLVAKLPLEGAKVTPQQAKAFLKELQALGAKYGITIKEGGVAGEAVGKARELTISLKAGAAHEMVHALQMVQVRATAFADEAARLGTSIAKMPASAFERAHTAIVKPFEHQAYAVFESMAFEATGLMGRAKAVNYRTALTTGIEAFSKGLEKAATPVLGEGLAARLYGELTILGRSQIEIGSKIAFGLKPTYEAANAAITAGMEKVFGR